MAPNNSAGNSTCAAPAVNEFSGEDIIPFDDCETVRNARQRRVSRILASTAPANRVPLANAIVPKDQPGATGLPLEVRASIYTNKVGILRNGYLANT